MAASSLKKTTVPAKKRASSSTAALAPKPPVWSIPTNSHLAPVLPPLSPSFNTTETSGSSLTGNNNNLSIPKTDLVLLLPVLAAPSERLFSDAPLFTAGILGETITHNWQLRPDSSANSPKLVLNNVSWIDQLKANGLIADYEAWSKRFRQTRQLGLDDLKDLCQQTHNNAIAYYLITEVWTDTTQSLRPANAGEWFLKLTNDTLPRHLNYLLKMRLSLVNTQTGQLLWQQDAETVFASSQLTSLSRSGVNTLDNQQALTSASRKLSAMMMPRLNAALHL